MLEKFLTAACVLGVAALILYAIVLYMGEPYPAPI